MTERTLIERLRGYTESDAYAEPWTFGVTCREAADALDAKDAEIARLRGLLSDALENNENWGDNARAALSQ